MDSNKMKEVVKDKYTKIARREKTCCCCGGDDAYSFVGEDYEQIEGYAEHADLGLGCGIPTAFAMIKKGDYVVDLGSGAGNDVFIARRLVGDSGKVTGIDFTEQMIQKAQENVQKLNLNNVEFKIGEIENLPLENDASDVIISNCVLNLVPDKDRAFREMYRILKPGGHFCVSDIVTNGDLPASLKTNAELYAGCIGGAVSQNEYIGIIEKSGFKNVEIKKIRKIDIPDTILESSLSPEKMHQYKTSKAGIYSITVVGYK